MLAGYTFPPIRAPYEPPRSAGAGATAVPPDGRDELRPFERHAVPTGRPYVLPSPLLPDIRDTILNEQIRHMTDEFGKPLLPMINATSIMRNVTSSLPLQPPPSQQGSAEDMIATSVNSGLALVMLSVLALLVNLLMVILLVSSRRMRTGPHLLLLNVAISDILYVVVATPSSTVGQIAPSNIAPAICSFLHYSIFVSVYVGAYTLVVLAVFRLFSAVMNSKMTLLLSIPNACLSCLAVWIAFLTSHVNILLQPDSTRFPKPFLCNPDTEHSPQEGRPTRTLWLTFVVCAFVVPICLIVVLSGLFSSPGREFESLEAKAEARSRRSISRLTLCSAIVRFCCWLPLQVFVLLDVFEMVSLDRDIYERAQRAGVCLTLVSTVVAPLVYGTSSLQFRLAFQDALACCLPKTTNVGNVCDSRPTSSCRDNGSDMNETILSILSDSNNHIDYALPTDDA